MSVTATPPRLDPQHLARLERVLDLARWAPSGDNTQPWRFHIQDSHHLVIHTRDTRDHCVYDLRGRASQIAIGAMLETLTIAATSHNLNTRFHRRPQSPESEPVFDAYLTETPAPKPDPLAAYIRQRTTQRRPMSTTPLTHTQCVKLSSCVQPGHRLIWLDRPQTRLRVAKLLFRSAHIRLTIPEAYRVHRDVIQWNSRFSEDRVPDRAVGMDPLGLRLMHWAMGRWSRVRFLNRYLAGTWLPRLELDVLPAVCCGAHFVITAGDPPKTIDDFIAAGRSVQRFWLTATSLGLLCQPEMTPLIFSSYVREDLRFCESPRAWNRAGKITKQLQSIIGTDPLDRAVFMGRIGWGRRPRSRSTRLPLTKLIHYPHLDNSFFVDPNEPRP